MEDRNNIVELTNETYAELIEAKTKLYVIANLLDNEKYVTSETIRNILNA